jgi:soluble lytic murein transglycosylase-like protein
VQYWGDQIVKWASEHNLDPNIVATIMQVESCGNHRVASGAGAQGLFQVMPFHFTNGEDMLDPDTNAARGLNYYVERMEQTGGDIGLSFAGYNGGHVAAATTYNNWFNETQRYFEWTTGIMADIEAGYAQSPTLERWFAAGGSSLCRGAAQQLGLR